MREVGLVRGRGGVEISPPRVELGGRLDGVATAVFPYVYLPEPDPIPTHFVRLVVLAFSSDGNEVGVARHTPQKEYDSTYAFARIPVAELAQPVTPARHALSGVRAGGG